MNNLFRKSDGSSITNITGTLDLNASDFEPIPSGTIAIAAITSSEFDYYNDENLIKLTWTILDGRYKKRKVFQKLYVNSQDKKKADRHKEMFAAIDKNCGGELMRLERGIENMDMAMHLSNKPMMISIEQWELDGKSGNWVSKVAPNDGSVKSTVHEEKTSDYSFDDDIPF